MAGRKRKPTAVRAREGNRGHRPIPQGEPQYPEGTRPPRGMSKGARNEWDRVYPLLTEQRVLTRADRAALAAYCVHYDRWQQAEASVRRHFEKYRTYCVRTDTTVKPLPDIAVANQAQSEMRKWAAELGLTPASRSKVSAGQGKPGGESLLERLTRSGLSGGAQPPHEEQPN